MRYRLDIMSLRDGTLVIEGWAIPEQGGKIEYSLENPGGSERAFSVTERERADVAKVYGCGLMCGFTLSAPFQRDETAVLVMKDGGFFRRIRVNYRAIERKNSLKNRKAERFLSLLRAETFRVSIEFIGKNGIRAFLKKAFHRLKNIEEDFDYTEWEPRVRISAEELDEQRKNWSAMSFPDGRPPLISIVIPAYNTPEKYLRMLYDSLIAQTYPVFEAIVADGSEEDCDTVRRVTEEYSGKDPRFRAKDCDQNKFKHGASVTIL